MRKIFNITTIQSFFILSMDLGLIQIPHLHEAYFLHQMLVSELYQQQPKIVQLSRRVDKQSAVLRYDRWEFILLKFDKMETV